MTDDVTSGRVARIHEAPLMREQVYQVLLDRLVKGELQPGDHVPERVVALELGVSSTPVKEALRRLENEGFVHAIPRRGVVVSENARTSLGDVVAVRAWLESLAARLTAARFASGDIGDQQRARMAQAAKSVVPRGTHSDPAAMARVNAEFHDLLRHLSGNRLIVQFVGTVLSIDSAVRLQALSDADELRRGIAEHQAIARAVLAGDPAEAELLMRDHVLRSGAHTLGIVVAGTPPEEGDDL